MSTNIFSHAEIKTPILETTLPDSKKSIEYRPFMMKEEKIFMMIQNSDNVKEVIANLIQVFESCTFNKVDIASLSSIDFEWLFLQLRMKSRGETEQLYFRCKKPLPKELIGEDGNPICNGKAIVNLDLEQIQPFYPDKKPKKLFKIPNTNVSIEMKAPNVSMIEFIGLFGKETTEDVLYDMALSLVDIVYIGDEVHTDFSIDHLKEFAEQYFTSALFEEIDTKFIQKLPYLKKDISFTCPKCGAQHEMELKGLGDFFVS